MQPFSTVLVPGRHHLLTRFQAHALHALLAGRGEVAVRPDAQIVFAVTSANHQGTRRNPLPAHRREAAIEAFAAREGFDVLVVPVVDIAPTPRFAEVTIKAVAHETGLHLTPVDTLVACSTPVADLYVAAGFVIDRLEAAVEPEPLRPWELVELLAAGEESWRDLAHPASVGLIDRYGYAERIRTVFADDLVSVEGALTSTRSYRTYVAAFEASAARKWAEVQPYVRPGRIVDVGCASGALLELASREPRLHESDLFGIEVDRHLVAEFSHRKAQGVFANPNTFVVHANILAADVFPPETVDTTLSLALTHELLSYGDGVDEVRLFARRVHRHSRPGGVWINADVCGPDEPDRPVVLEVASDDGDDPGRVLAPGEVGEAIEALSTRARLVQFAHDFPRLAGCAFAVEELRPGVFATTLRDAMEFLTRKDYTDSWLSECHERFCTLDAAGWFALVEEAGFVVDPASRGWRNDWIVANRLAPVARLLDLGGEPLQWPTTHVLVVARRPPR